MKAVFKTRAELIADGFKPNYPYWYKDNKKDPIAKIREHLITNLGGKTLTIVDVEDASRGTLEATYKGRTYTLEVWMFKETIEFEKVTAPPAIKIRGEDVKFRGIDFEFDCRHQHLRVKDAVKLANWVLKMAKGKT